MSTGRFSMVNCLARNTSHMKIRQEINDKTYRPDIWDVNWNLLHDCERMNNIVCFRYYLFQLIYTNIYVLIILSNTKSNPIWWKENPLKRYDEGETLHIIGASSLVPAWHCSRGWTASPVSQYRWSTGRPWILAVELVCQKHTC